VDSPTGPDSSDDYRYRVYEPGDERAILPLLQESLAWKGMTEQDWRWKHASRPGFTNEDVVTVSRDGEMVACFHGAVLPLHLGDGLEVLADFDGDFVVAPEHRRKDIPTVAVHLNSERLLDLGVALRGGFTTEALNRRFYQKRYGYVFVPSASLDFRRLLTVEALRPKATRLGARLLGGRRLPAAVGDRPLIANVSVAGLPDCWAELGSEGLVLHDGWSDGAELSVRVPYRLVAARAHTRSRLLAALVADLGRGRVRTTGVVRNRRRLAALAAALVLDAPRLWRQRASGAALEPSKARR
jgi:hypothetical protein